MIKPYSKKANPVKLEKLDAADLAGCNTATISDTRPQSEIQGLCDSLDKLITTLCERLDCLEVRLTPVVKDDNDGVREEGKGWNLISSTPIGNQLEGYCARLDSMVNGVNVLIDRLGV